MHKRLIERTVESEVVQGKINILYTLKGIGVTEENLESLIKDLKLDSLKVNKQITDYVGTYFS